MMNSIFSGARAANEFFGLEEYSDKLSQDIEQYAQGDITGGEVALRATGETGRAVGDAMAAPIMAALSYAPDSIKEAAMKVAQGVAETDTVQDLMAWAEANPRAARNLESVFNSVDILPVGALAKGGSRAIMQNVVEEIPTKLPGFYEGGLKAVKAFSKGAIEGVPQAIKRPFSPTARAQAEAIGTGKRRIREAVDAPLTESRGSIEASTFIRKQADRRTGDETLMDIGPTAQSEKLAHTRLTDKPTIYRAMTSDLPEGELPPEVLERMIERPLAALEPGKSGAARVRRSIFSDMRKRKPKDTQVVVRDLGAPNSDLQLEARAAASINNRGMLALTTPSTLNLYKKTHGITGDLTPAQTMDLLKTASLFERGMWKMGPMQKGVHKIYPPSKNKKTGKMVGVGQQKALENYLGAKLAVQNYERRLAKWNTPEYYKTTAKKGQLKPKGPKPQNITPQQQQLLDLVDSNLEQASPNIGRDGDWVHYTTSYASQAKDLGGVGSRIAVNTKTGELYHTIFDGHDIFDIDPAGGDSLFNLTPIQKRMVGGGDRPDLKPSAASQAKQAAGAKALEERTGIPRRIEYFKTGDNAGKPKPPGPGGSETYLAYEKRVFDTYKAQVTARHKREAAQAGMLTGIAAFDTQQQEQQ